MMHLLGGLHDDEAWSTVFNQGQFRRGISSGWLDVQHEWAKVRRLLHHLQRNIDSSRTASDWIALPDRRRILALLLVDQRVVRCS